MRDGQKYSSGEFPATPGRRSNPKSPGGIPSHGKDGSVQLPCPKRILIVDEDILSIVDLSRALLRFGYVLSHATDQVRAVEAVKNEKPDLIICTPDGRKLDTPQFVKTVQRLPWSRSIPFLFLIESGDGSDQAPQILGPIQYLARPFTSEQLSSAVQEQLARRRARPAR
ncbi:MAG: hypothetical protein NTU47_12500 [Ignavibacteriales bacterium]|nr:hypothetical protein [Ignavibacteriales bacterium]